MSYMVKFVIICDWLLYNIPERLN